MGYLLTEEKRKELVAAAVAAKAGAYCKYSQFRVGAALLTTDGEIITGANVENASYGLTICAERTAVFTAVTALPAKPRPFAAMAIAADVDPPVSPCGACRQVLAELGTAELEVIMVGADGTTVCRTLGELLPLSFSLSR
ncbi:MAG: cytidine deaminase [Candidatus Schekmanbacteria bacterium]|nr:cytidine deaminase [Candidatus Schekmanbacteria bacterium]